METWKIFLIVAGASAAVTTIALVAKSHKTGAVQSDEQLLKSVFGEPVFSGHFTMKETKDWLLARKEKLIDGFKGVVLKATPEALQSLGLTAEISKDMEKRLIIAIIDMDKHKISDSVLIQYNTLDQDLEEHLERGKGVLVIGG